MEKEKTEMQTERDRLLREIEVLSQRINTLQRQLHSQQVCLFSLIRPNLVFYVHL
ncbi:hypothetical protein PGB90_007265 [Kerria lacca]